jgi:hypothetical protein
MVRPCLHHLQPAVFVHDDRGRADVDAGAALLWAGELVGFAGRGAIVDEQTSRLENLVGIDAVR